ncbi:T9SS type A sorting domain-containing protein [Dyadobacter sp. 32]|uniref:T9SS type A sorting domain-containing protein n=1 Tax=Dyadobacter sp. 32 TaxID=538966 RepID=UPI0039C6CBDE
MRKHYTLKYVFHFLFIFPALLTGTSNANAALSKGDLVVIGMNAAADATPTTTRSFAVLALSKIAADEIIKITDRGWIVGTPSKFTTSTTLDGTLQWELSKDVPAGTVIIFKIDMASNTSKTVSATKGDGTALSSGDVLTLSGWTQTPVTSLPWNNNTGDQLLIYQGDDDNPSFIFAFNNLRTTGISNLGDNNWFYDPTGVSGLVTQTTSIIYSELPPGMEDYSVAIVTNSNPSTRYANEKYYPKIEVGTKATWLADIRKIANWIHPVDVNTPYDFGLGFGADNRTQFEMRISVTISSSAGISGATTLDSPIPFTVTFSEAVTGFDAGDITPGNATISGFSGSGTTYTFDLIPAAFGAVTVDIAENKALSSALTGNIAAEQFVITYQQTLPVTLIYYSVKAENNTAKLEWSTASEKDNGHYAIEHATDAKTFKVIGIVEVGGSSPVKRNYVWYDRSPEKGTNYYRLVQVDIDGKATRYGIKALNFDVLVYPYPNPAVEKVTLSFPQKALSVELTAVNGKILRNFLLSENETTISIPVSDLLPGTYFIRLLTVNGAIYRKFVKL